MTLNDICNLPRNQKAIIGERIAKKYLAMTKLNPGKVIIHEGTMAITVNDYPSDWMIIHGQKVIDNYLKVRG